MASKRKAQDIFLRSDVFYRSTNRLAWQPLPAYCVWRALGCDASPVWCQVHDNTGDLVGLPHADGPRGGNFWVLNSVVEGECWALDARARKAPRIVLAFPVAQSEVGGIAASQGRGSSVNRQGLGDASLKEAGFASFDAQGRPLDAIVWLGARAGLQGPQQACPFLVRAEWEQAGSVEAFWGSRWNRTIVCETAKAFVRAVAAQQSLRLAMGRFLSISARDEALALVSESAPHGDAGMGTVGDAGWMGCGKDESAGWQWGANGVCQGPLLDAIVACLRECPRVIEPEGGGPPCSISQARIRPGASGCVVRGVARGVARLPYAACFLRGAESQG